MEAPKLQSKYICLVCIGEVEEYITCHNPKCKSIVCYDCAKSYVEHCANDNKIPQCPTVGCKNKFLLSSIKKLDDRNVEKIYVKACYDYFMIEKKQDNEDYIVYNDLIDKIRKERVNFIRGEFPPSITLVINIALKTKLNKINKKNKSFSVAEDKSSRLCMVSYCNGKLDDNMTCIKCETKFCKDCEIALINGHEHKCKEEDIKSVDLINNMVRCPKCFLPVLKSMGCNAITCAVCNTNFDYLSGENSLAGNHGQSVMFDVQDYNLLSVIYKEHYSKNCIAVLQEIENLKPSFPDVNSINKLIRKIYMDNLNKKADTTSMTKLAKAFENNELSKFNYVKYMSIYSSIELHHNKATLNFKQLKEILKEILK